MFNLTGVNLEQWFVCWLELCLRCPNTLFEQTPVNQKQSESTLVVVKYQVGF